ncbi:hypothetical protein DFAR_810002 [Desulfarculales bacterium]
MLLPKPLHIQGVARLTPTPLSHPAPHDPNRSSYHYCPDLDRQPSVKQKASPKSGGLI